MSVAVALDRISGVIRITLEGNTSQADFAAINEAVNESLDEPEFGEAVLVFDFRGVLTTPHNVQSLRASQTYANRGELRWICVMGDNKFMRLIMTLTFSLAKAQLRFFADARLFEAFIEANIRRGRDLPTH